MGVGVTRGLEVTADDQRPVWCEGGWGCGLEATADDHRQRCVLWGEFRQWELESARREGEGEGAPQQQSTACQNERRTRSVGLEAFSHVCSCEKNYFRCVVLNFLQPVHLINGCQ